MIFTFLLYFLFGWFVIKHGKPIYFAVAYAGVLVVWDLILAGPSIDTLLGGLIVFGFAALVFLIVDRYCDRVFAPLLALATGGLVLLSLWLYV